MMNIQMDAGVIAVGGSQLWYPSIMRRLSGCGPTTASNIIWYISRSQPSLNLCKSSKGTLAEYKTLQNEMFNYITPGIRGVNKSGQFSKGAIAYGVDHGVTLLEHILEIPRQLDKRPTWETVCHFLIAALTSNYPVAFLNLNKGSLTNLDSWHWVTILALDTDRKCVTISDQSRKFDIQLDNWLSSSTIGGAMVYLTTL
jgi:hypothetical protein